MADYADFEIIAELVSDDPKTRKILIRCIAEIDGVGYLQDDIGLVFSSKIDSDNKLAVHIMDNIVAPWFEMLTKPPLENCPNDNTPLQNGECMVCGWRTV